MFAVEVDEDGLHLGDTGGPANKHHLVDRGSEGGKEGGRDGRKDE